MDGSRLRLSRGEFLLSCVAGVGAAFANGAVPPKPIVVSVNVMFDLSAHNGHGLAEREIALFNAYQERARREYAVSGIHFEIQLTENAYLRQQGYSEIPDKFLKPQSINLLVTDSLGYDIDRDRTGGCSSGPHPRKAKSPPDPFYKTFLGLKDANADTLPHEYAHHFCLDTRRTRTWTSNFWADVRNNYWLARQRRGAPIPAFRACATSEWAKYEVNPVPTSAPHSPSAALISR
jgi:hypothetical protein